MACSSITLKGIGLGCKDNMGGIKEVYLIKEDDVTVTLDVAKAEVASIEVADGASFKTYKFRKGTSTTPIPTTGQTKPAGTMSISVASMAHK